MKRTFTFFTYLLFLCLILSNNNCFKNTFNHRWSFNPIILYLLGSMFHCRKPSFSPFRCFLSNDSKPVAAIIKNILQCVLDYGLCLTGGQLSVLDDSSETLELQSHINLSEVITSFTWNCVLLVDLSGWFLR